MEENFSKEWNMEWKIFSIEWKKIASLDNGKIVFHSMPWFLQDQNNFLFTKTFTHVLKRKTTNNERKNETEVFCQCIAYCFAQLHIAQHDGKKSFYNKPIVMFLTFVSQSFDV